MKTTRGFTPALLLLLLLTAFCQITASAGPTGKIAGLIKDKATGDPLIGVNIVVEGTTMGAATDIEGRYVILNVPPGDYNLTASLVGYTRVRQTNVKVNIDLTSTVNFDMSEASLELGEEVIVVADKPLVQKDLTASTAIVGKEQLSALPVTEFSQALSLQAGFVAGSLRGGRRGEVAYWIDGVPVTDVYDGSQVVEVNKNLIQEVQLVAGAFNAEYGQAMSGIVNIATREGGRNFSGGVSAYIGDYVSSHKDIFPGIDDVSPTAIRNVEANLSGPIAGDRLTFFGNVRYIYFDGYLSGFRRFNPQNISFTDPTTNNFILSRDTDGQGDSARVSMNWSRRAYAQGKLTWKPLDLLKLSYNYIYDANDNKAYDRDYFYNPDGKGVTRSISNTQIVQLTHTLSNSTFYTIGASYFDRDVKYRLYDDPNDPRYVHPKLFLKHDPYSFLTGGTDLGRFHRSTQTALLKFDLSTQLTSQHLIKIGVEYRGHRLYYENITLDPIESQTDINLATDSPYIQTRILDISSTKYDTYTKKPMELSAYIQDKMEFQDLIINIGVRVDYFEPDGVVLTDESDPNIYNPIKPSNIFFDYDGNGVRDTLTEPFKSVEDRRAYWYKKASPKIQLSPRFGASFPITDRGVVHFSYGYFFQTPRFERLYENPNFKIGQGTGNQGVVGNADLKPEQTIKGEIGLQQAISEDLTADVTAYFQDIRNLTSTRSDEILVFGGASRYSKYVNSDFGFIKGVALTVDKRFGGGFMASVYYTYQVARGSASDPNEARNAVAGGALPEVQLTPLGWDQRHTLNATASYDGDGYGVSLIGSYGSGTPYTPRRSTDITSLLTNSEIKPTYFNLDLRTYYEIDLSALKIVLYARVFNLLDTKNEVGVFDDTGRAGFTTDKEKVEAIHPTEFVNNVDQWFIYPTNYSEPRRIELGMNIEF